MSTSSCFSYVRGEGCWKSVRARSCLKKTTEPQSSSHVLLRTIILHSGVMHGSCVILSCLKCSGYSFSSTGTTSSSSCCQDFVEFARHLSFETLQNEWSVQRRFDVQCLEGRQFNLALKQSGNIKTCYYNDTH